MQYREDLLLGHDAEVFLKQGDSYISAIGKVGGSKSRPRPVRLGALQEDNVLAEMNITPAANKHDFIGNTVEVMNQLKDIVAPYHLDIKSSADFLYEDLVDAGPKAFALGCDSDYNAYTGEENESPQSDTTLRTAAGHIHFGITDCKWDITSIVKMADIMLGIPSVMLDEDVKRRQMYGKAGCFRPKDYGVEYRTLGNFWLASQELMGWVFDTSHRILDGMQDLASMYEKVSEKEVQFIINTSDRRLATQAIRVLNLQMP